MTAARLGVVFEIVTAIEHEIQCGACNVRSRGKEHSSPKGV